ncbi:hypothetical protein [Acidiphilium angustum]|uniref:hypothetical protein n=1 Tax=Acidiphilium angustum TaxID=523 RepID=UPI0004940A14|nr:hypothetical protein [Acidiphilium angustum]
MLIPLYASIPLAAAIGLYSNRIRGGLYALPGGDLPARIIGALGLGIVPFLAQSPPLVCLAVAVAALIGELISGSDGSYSMNNGVKSWIFMALYGIERLALICAVLWWFGDLPEALWFAAPLCPLAYYLARFWPISIGFLGIKAASGTNAAGEDAGFGEALWGAIVGALLLLTVAGIWP